LSYLAGFGYFLKSLTIFHFHVTFLIHSIEILNDDSTNILYDIQIVQEKFDSNKESLNTLVQSSINTVKNVNMMSNDAGIINLKKNIFV
jgi:hypothetical protein